MASTKIEDSNLANYGSAEHIAARLEAARTAEEWKGAGENKGLQIWRIEKMNVKPWPTTKYGQFFDGDSFIVLYTYTEEGSDKKKFNVHFWIGEKSTQDEYTIAAYKTVELDDLLGDMPVQFREVQEHESQQFLSYFTAETSHPLHIQSGGVESGFNKMKPEEFKPRLYHVKGKKNLHISEVPLKTSSLNLGDVYLLDAGQKLYIWEPSSASRVEKFAASRLSVQIRDDRGKCEEEHLDEDGSDEFWALFDGDRSEVKSASEVAADDAEPKVTEPSLWCLSDSSGPLSFDKVSSGKISASQLDSKDVFVVDVGALVFIWIGKNASAGERKNAMRYADSYLSKENRRFIPLERVLEGHEEENADWKKYVL